MRPGREFSTPTPSQSMGFADERKKEWRSSPSEICQGAKRHPSSSCECPISSDLTSTHILFQVSAIAVSASLGYLAVGLADGTVLLYRHLDQSIYSNSTSLTNVPKPRVVHESPTEPVTGLGFREATDDNLNIYLFIVTINRVLAYQVSGKGSGGTPTAVDEVGCGLGCAAMDWHAKDVVVARDEAIYICGIEGRGACYAYEGDDIARSHLDYI